MWYELIRYHIRAYFQRFIQKRVLTNRQRLQDGTVGSRDSPHSRPVEILIYDICSKDDNVRERGKFSGRF